MNTRVQHETPEENWKTYCPKHCEHNKDEVNSTNTQSNYNYQASSQNFRQITCIKFLVIELLSITKQKNFKYGLLWLEGLASTAILLQYLCPSSGQNHLSHWSVPLREKEQDSTDKKITYNHLYWWHFLSIQTLFGLVWFGFFIQWHINLHVLFNANTILKEL